MKEFIRKVLLAAGYEIRHKSVATADPFRQQGLLLSGVATPVIFDVGANIGTVAEKYRTIFPSGKIYAFEPFPEVFTQLEQRVSGDKGIIPCQLALGSVQAKKPLRVNASSPTNSLLETDESAASIWGKGLLETSRTVDVEVDALDDFCRRNQIENIEVLKLDTQGTELEILKGAAEMLSAGRIRVIYTEMIIAPSYRGQPRPHEVMSFLDGMGYRLFGLYNLWSLNDGRLLQLDAIFVRT